MRIIGGAAAGVILQAPKGYDVRPTPDLVRQAIFNSLGPRVNGAEVLELFGGTGALSLECLSRGAAHALCVEKSSRHAEYIRRNLELTRQSAEKSLPPIRVFHPEPGPEAMPLEVRVQDAFSAIAQLVQQGREFDLILADPPFGEKNIGRRSTSLSQQLLDDPHLPKMLRLGGVFVLGHTKRDTLTVPLLWREVKLLKHGDSMMRFLARPPV